MPRGFNVKIWMPTLSGVVYGYDEAIVRFYWFGIRLPGVVGRWMWQRHRKERDAVVL